MEVLLNKVKIHTLTSEQQQEKMREIQIKLQGEEAQKARKLLSSAMTHFEALKHVRTQLEEKALNGSYAAGIRLFKN